jgi:ribosomal protein S18 acetylase RimI-like enzyme
MKPDQIAIRRATPDDAASIHSIWAAIAAEKRYSAIDKPFSIEEERAYLQSLSEREAYFIAEASDHMIVAFQSLDLWARVISSMDHVGQLGTFVLPAWRGRGIGKQLAQESLTFARGHGYEKIVIFVRASNTSAQGFYTGLGFKPCGLFSRQVKIDDTYDDEVLMEMFL